MKEVKFAVDGIKCTGCENRILNSLNMVDGIQKVIASHVGGTVFVKMDESVDINGIKKHIEDLGFEVSEEEQL